MNDSFFLKPNSKRKEAPSGSVPDPKKRKLHKTPQDKRNPNRPSKPVKKNTGPRKPVPDRKEREDEEQIMDFESLVNHSDSEEKVQEESEEEDPFADETADEKRARLAKKYLEKLKALQTNEESDEESGDQIGDFLQTEALKAQTGRSQKFLRIASKIQNQDLVVKFRKCHQLSVTCVTISDDDKFLFTASKDCCVIQWDLQTMTKLHTYKGSRNNTKTDGHSHHVLSVAISSDSELLATGGSDNVIKIWDPKKYTCSMTFKGHRDSITSLAFRLRTHDLFSGSADRTIKLWDGNSLAYIDTLYGHQSPVTAIDCYKQERCISGSSDKTTRLFKVDTSSQLVFQGSNASIDCLALLTEEMWVTGGEHGDIQMWHFQKKRPACVVPLAHGKNGVNSNWITAIAAVKFGDLIATGSCDGNIKLWHTKDNKIIFIKDLPGVVGFVNSLKFSASGKYLVAGVGQEPSLGRWSKIKEAKNGVCVIALEID